MIIEDEVDKTIVDNICKKCVRVIKPEALNCGCKEQ